MSHPILVGVALREDDAAPLALGRDLARLIAAPLALVHAYPYEPISRVPVAEYGRERRARSLASLDQVAEPLRDELEVTVHVGPGSSPAAVLHDAAHAFGALIQTGPEALQSWPAARQAVIVAEVTDAFRAAFLAVAVFATGALALAWSIPMRRLS